MISRQGHTPTFLLILEGLVLMLVAWLAFFNQVQDIESLDASISAPLSDLAYNEAYVSALLPLLVERARLDSRAASDREFLDQFNEHLAARSEAVRSLSAHRTSVLGLITEQTYSVTPEGELYVFRLADISVIARSGEGGINHFTRTFDLEIRFTRERVVSVHKVYKQPSSF